MKGGPLRKMINATQTAESNLKSEQIVRALCGGPTANTRLLHGKQLGGGPRSRGRKAEGKQRSGTQQEVLKCGQVLKCGHGTRSANKNKMFF